MQRQDFHFELPAHLIAQHPLEQRSASRLLTLDRTSGAVADRHFAELPGLLAANDLLVFNDTSVLRARLHGRKASGGAVEILIERLLDDQLALAQVRASKSPPPESLIMIGDQELTVVGRDGVFFILRSRCAWSSLLERFGRIPLPPYIRRAADELDERRYQTVYAQRPGAVAAPTAGLHFDQAMLTGLGQRQIATGFVTLHVGAGTFQPMRVARIEQHKMHHEWVDVGTELCRQLAVCKRRGGRVIAVGTTSLRALESAWQDGRVQPFRGDTDLFIYPGRPVRSIDGLITNFHLPESTLLMLVSAFAGTEAVLAAYRHAVEQGYRFFSYGDAMLIV